MSRASWSTLLNLLSRPVFAALATGELRRRMPVEARPGAGRAAYAHLEAADHAL